MTHQYSGDFNYRVCPIHGAYPQFAVMCPQCVGASQQAPYSYLNTESISQALVVERLSPTAILPTKAHMGDLGYDLYSNEPVYFQGGEIKCVNTGIRVKFPDGWGAKIFDRSSVATKRGLVVVAGVIDNAYRGTIQIAMHNTSHTYIANIVRGEKIAQFVPMKVIDWDIVEGVVDQEETTRGSGGFGSTG